MELIKKANYTVDKNHIKHECGSWYETARIQIDDEISIFSAEGQFVKDITLIVPVQEQYISLFFLLDGSITSYDEEGGIHSATSAGEINLVFHRGFNGTTILHKTAKFAVFSIVMPSDFIRRLFKGDVPIKIMQLLTCQQRESYCYQQVIMTPLIESVLHQLKRTQMTKELKPYFIASKAYELITYCFEQFTKESQTGLNLTENDVDCLNKARRILSENIVEPPTIIQLSRIVGINDCKLKRGFKQLFNTTPFAYVQELRMTQAKQSLQNGNVSVTSVANQVGYSNVGHFSAAFRKYHGATPRNFKKTFVNMSVSALNLESIRTRSS